MSFVEAQRTKKGSPSNKSQSYSQRMKEQEKGFGAVLACGPDKPNQNPQVVARKKLIK